MGFTIASLSSITAADIVGSACGAAGTTELHAQLAVNHPNQKQLACLVADAKSRQAPITLDLNFFFKGYKFKHLRVAF